MSESTSENAKPPFSLPIEKRTASPTVLSTTEKPTLSKIVQAPEIRDPSAIVGDEILAQKGQKSVDVAVAHAREDNMTDALSALQQGEPPSGLVELATLSAAASERGDSKPLVLDPSKCADIAHSFVGQDKKSVRAMLNKFNLSKDTKEAIMDNIPEGPLNNSDVSQGEQEIRQAQVDALSEQAKQSGEQQIAALNAQIAEEEAGGKPDSKLARSLKQQRANVTRRMKNIEHWLKAPPKEWAGRVGSFIYWTIVLYCMLVIMEMAAINKMAGKTK